VDGSVETTLSVGNSVYYSAWNVSFSANSVTLTMVPAPESDIFYSSDPFNGPVFTVLSGSPFSSVTSVVAMNPDCVPCNAITAFVAGNSLFINWQGAGGGVGDSITINFAPAPPTPLVVDNWISSSGANWTMATDWSAGVPNSNSEVVISQASNYTVNISSAVVAYSLYINDMAAIVSDNKGSLTLGGGSGTLAIPNGTFQLAGGSLQAGTIWIGSGGALLISKGNFSRSNALSEAITDNGSLTVDTSATISGNISGTGNILAENTANLAITGTLSGSELFTVANSAHSLISTAVSGTGSFVIANSGVLEFGAEDSENVSFASGATGTLKLDHSLTAPFTGSVSGLTSKDTIDLADLTWVKGHMTAGFSGNTSGGTLTVSNGTNSVALKLLGDYTTASWTLSKDSAGGTRVVDPPVTGSLSPRANGGAGRNDLSGIGFGANTTLGYSPNGDNTSGTLTASDGLHAQSVALLAQYMASSFVMAGSGHGGTLSTEPPSNQELVLTHPHA
jgi:hypothetical protein